MGRAQCEIGQDKERPNPVRPWSWTTRWPPIGETGVMVWRTLSPWHTCRSTQAHGCRLSAAGPACSGQGSVHAVCSSLPRGPELPGEESSAHPLPNSLAPHHRPHCFCPCAVPEGDLACRSTNTVLSRSERPALRLALVICGRRCFHWLWVFACHNEKGVTCPGCCVSVGWNDVP